MSTVLKNVEYSPIKGYTNLRVSSKYGFRTFYNGVTKKYEKGFHNGIDLTTGNIVVAPEDGEVSEVCDKINGYSEKNSRGNYVILKHDDGVYTAYYHLKKDSISVSKGDRVKRGEKLAEVGATGHATGVHLHYGVKIDSSWVNPEDYLLGRKSLVQERSEIKDDVYYTVKAGDSLSEIAEEYGITCEELAKINEIADPDFISVGQKIKVPMPREKTYRVGKGDTLSGIAKKYHTTWEKLYEKNKDRIGDNPDFIRVGLVLRI